MEKNYDSKAKVPLMQSNSIRKNHEVDFTKKSTRPMFNKLMIGTVLLLCLLIVEVWCITNTVKNIDTLRHEDGNKSEKTYGSHKAGSSVILESCDRTLPCHVMTQDSYVTLLKLMYAIKWQFTSTKRKSKNPMKSLIHSNCYHFIVSDYTEGSLRWMNNYYGSQLEGNGSVTITENGMYGLYNTMTFAILNQQNFDKAEIFHRILLESPAGNRSLVLFERNIVLFLRSQSFVTSSFFGFKYLHAEDCIYPTISNKHFLYGSPMANIWGVFRVREGSRF
ncbi:uncharacterized protein LOC132564021 [Ylistrum balloti]|uniref:uncharacterized protein LOC132564021 n=1 Tax=Ylistrum balloti TaxID=509963 RepID=UPI002905BD7C|nr:uncharacterized protein LOC132564021 [Ylistrum balloti]